ncbi:HD domain-containing protein [Flavobacterium sp. CF108]|jgi:predicted metal-dependent HD superfamily phosphohydrolase|uniref:Pycsar system effector family protein n=1 Tax=unclassified Flavobacterium TaxID=196869 RepID=UPI0008ACF005|nr:MULTISPECIES: Pycsar system effector family protein [unclassified Flavobacterium]SEN86757.1 HD domain-containing protein [Flavobacterium sp. fv08]SHH21902.1 HD domain-containing protein [Flavobacterium sp. CF108]
MNLIEQSEDFVGNLLKDKLSNLYSYHNFNHTFTVVTAVKELCKKEDVESDDKEALLAAAWFHDTGYIEGYENHEVKSVKIAADFLKEKGKSEKFIELVSSLILATARDYHPKTHLEKIIKDADYAHLMGTEYVTTIELLRLELKNTGIVNFSNAEWTKENLDFLLNKHRFYTDYALRKWQPLKEKNLILIQKKISKQELKAAEELEKETKKSEKVEKPDRGVDTLFRVTLGNHTRLSGIADSKANILLSVNAIIISIALSSIIPKLDSPKNAHLVIPTFIMLMSSVITIIFAILSTRPKVTSGVFTREDIENKKINLLFFGNFYKMPLEEYDWAMNEMMKDRDYLYSNMIKDLYYLGLVLQRKYNLLRIAYNLFMFGIIVTVIAFVIAFKSI